MFSYLQDQINVNDILFINPSIVFLVNFVESDELGAILSDLDLVNKKIIFIPINDNADINRSGGSHWSLLVWNIEQSCFHYFDSMSNYNLQSAKRTKTVFEKALKMKDQKFEIVKCPQQNNSYDCGVYTLYFAELTAKNMECWKETDNISKTISIINDSNVRKKRDEIRSIIEKLRQ